MLVNMCVQEIYFIQWSRAVKVVEAVLIVGLMASKIFVSNPKKFLINKIALKKKATADARLRKVSE